MGKDKKVKKEPAPAPMVHPNDDPSPEGAARRSRLQGMANPYRDPYSGAIDTNAARLKDHDMMFSVKSNPTMFDHKERAGLLMEGERLQEKRAAQQAAWQARQAELVIAERQRRAATQTPPAPPQPPPMVAPAAPLRPTTLSPEDVAAMELAAKRRGGSKPTYGKADCGSCHAGYVEKQPDDKCPPCGTDLTLPTK